MQTILPFAPRETWEATKQVERIHVPRAQKGFSPTRSQVHCVPGSKNVQRELNAVEASKGIEEESSTIPG